MKSFIFLLILAFTSISFAFTINSPNNPNYRGWANPEIKFALNLSDCPSSVDVRGIIKDALDVWNNVPTSRVKLSIVGDTTSTVASDPITVMCSTTYGTTNPSGGGANDSPGAAVNQPFSGSDYTTAGIMYLNASSGQANIANFSRSLVAVVLAHEFGHLIGLGHSQDTAALMYYDATAKGYLGLAQDDIDGITYLYPRNELGQDKIAGCALVKSLPPQPPTGSMMWSLLLSLMLPMIVWGKLKRQAA